MDPTQLHLGQAYFFLCAALAIAGAVVTVVAKNPIRSAMGLLFMILNIAGLFLALHAQFLAAIQLIVYAGAIVVLFLFVIMLLGPASTPPFDHRGRVPRAIGAAVFGGAGLSAMLLLYQATRPATPEAAKKAAMLLESPANDFGSIDQFGQILFSQGLLPFELSSALLMVAIVGAVAVARGKSKHDSPTARELAETPDPRLPEVAQ
jgi:NADH-quinone oxidoreductase subunit J